MDTTANALVEQLAAGFDTLQTEYQTLSGQYQSLERKLATAREQVRDNIPHAYIPSLAMMIHFSSRPAVASRGDGDRENISCIRCLICTYHVLATYEAVLRDAG